MSIPATRPRTRSSCGVESARSCAMQLLALERAAKAPIEAAVEREVAPGGDPLRALGDLVGLDLVVQRRRLDRHVAIEQQAVPSVVQVRGVAEQLVLRDFVHRRERVLVKGERVLPERGDAERRHAVGDFDERQPAARQQRRQRRVRAVGRGHRRLVGRRRGRGKRRVALLDAAPAAGAAGAARRRRPRWWSAASRRAAAR